MVSRCARISERIVTALSCLQHAHGAAPSQERALARKSLLLGLAMLGLNGCIIADPPQYEEPRRTPPILDLNNAVPSPYWLIVVDRKDNNPADKIHVKVPIRSDDQGEKLWFALHVDFKGENHVLNTDLPLAASTFDDTNRFIDFEYDVDGSVQKGCHQLTLIVAHDSSWDYMRQQPLPSAPKDDIAVANWWMNVDPPASDPYTLPDCPNQSEVDK